MKADGMSITETNNSGNNDDTSDKFKTLEKKFNFLAQEVSKSYIEKTSIRHKELEKKLSEFISLTEKKLFNKCEENIKTIMKISQNEQMVDQSKGTVILQLKPKQGHEEEYTTKSSELMECVKPYLLMVENVLEYKNYFQQLNNVSYSLCISECKNNLKNSVVNNTLNYDNVKYCLKDCYNLGSFNFKSYYEYIQNDLDLKSENMNKI
jgi:hypothetical protein